MSCLRLLLPPALVGLVLLLAGSRALQPAPSSQPAPPASPDPAAVQAVEQALERFGPGRLALLEMGIWHQVEVQDLCYQAEGRYLAGPDHRLRLDLKTRAGGTAGRLLVVCDGVTLWKSRQIGDETPAATRVALREVLAGTNNPAVLPAALGEYFPGPFGGGVGPLLRSLRDQVTWTRKETVRRDGRLLTRLTGAWQAGAEGPRRCRLYLDPRTRWPHRVEWWGPDPARAEDALLVQMEFRDPVWNRPLAAERSALEFAVPGGGAGAVDVTPQVMARLRPAPGHAP